ncbi:MAG TPA: tetratricopeptide repeat protein [Geminicoccus sp.]|uniref:SPOR domain-containing protein n=1 Tax=Geminicoccus sp. TaxID=2024832 RepID=UPI002E31A4C3|nr:tetratricopeptide repeat protein [Geminicoccus sp.]HEX2524957.1 tetratricopeptide repeat protein [Geminicoccus sp.]
MDMSSGVPLAQTMRPVRSIEQLCKRVTSILLTATLLCLSALAAVHASGDPLLDAYLEGVDLYRKGDLDAAIPKLRRAVELSEERNGDDSPELALDLNNLAEALRRAGQLPEAEKLLRRAYAIDQKQGEAGSAAAAATLNNLGLVLAAKGDQAGALNAHRAALAAAENSQGKDHPDTARAAYNLALAEAAAGDLEVAQALASRAAYVAERALGDRHPLTRQMRNTEARLRSMPRPSTAAVETAQLPKASPQPDLPKTATTEQARTPARKSGRTYAVQLVALRSESEIDAAWLALRQRYRRLGTTDRLPATFVDIEGRGRFYRLLVGPYMARADAEALCKGLKDDGGDCRVIIRN